MKAKKVNNYILNFNNSKHLKRSSELGLSKNIVVFCKSLWKRVNLALRHCNCDKDQKKILEVWLKIVPGVANSVPEL